MTRTKQASTAKVIPIRHASSGASVELFSGCGGLAMGMSLAGFEHKLLVEWNDEAYATVRHNQERRVRHVREWPYEHGDVRGIDWTRFRGTVDVVAGGPPCQPFSVGGKANGSNDERDMWPEAIRAVREVGPKAFLFENVRGLLRPAFADYVNWIAAYLSNPELKRKRSESHMDHLARLDRAAKRAAYEVKVVPVNAADYGSPQKRNRVVFAGIRTDLGAPLDFPKPTHSQERLVWDKWVSGEYWKRHGLTRPADAIIPNHEERILERLRNGLCAPTTKAWVTCRDAFLGLGEPGTRPDLLNHGFQDGARVYPGHTGSPIDEPAKALKAGVHGVPGGENMLAREDGSVRYFSMREAARLQGMPDDFEFPRSWTESMRQLGNAVPVALAKALGDWLANKVVILDSRQRVA